MAILICCAFFRLCSRAASPSSAFCVDFRAIRSRFPPGKISVIAHSFGTYASCQALAEPDIRLERLVLCGDSLSGETFAGTGTRHSSPSRAQ